MPESVLNILPKGLLADPQSKHEALCDSRGIAPGALKSKSATVSTQIPDAIIFSRIFCFQTHDTVWDRLK